MASQGPRFPGTTATVSDGSESAEAWVNPGNIVSDNGSEAQITAATYDNNDISQRLRASNFGFTIPAGDVIDGVTVEIERRAFAGSAKDFRVQIENGAGVLIGDNKATATAWPTTAGIATYGGVADVWGIAALTPTIVNSSGFGIVLSAQATGNNTDVGVDFIRVTIEHHTPATDKAGTDTSSGAEAASLAVDHPVTDVGAGIDVASHSHDRAVSDAASGSEVGLLVQEYAIADAGAGLEVADVLQIVDKGTAPDAGFGVDVPLLVAEVPAQVDSGAGVEAGALVTDRAVGDSTPATDSTGLSVDLTGSDYALNYEVAAQPEVIHPRSDAGTGADTSGLIVDISVSDTGVGAETSGVDTALSFAVSDQAVGTDRMASSMAEGSTAEMGEGHDAILLAVDRLVTDVASGSEATSLAQVFEFAVSDLATGTDGASPAAILAAIDVGASIDSARSEASHGVVDAGVGVEVGVQEVGQLQWPPKAQMSERGRLQSHLGERAAWAGIPQDEGHRSKGTLTERGRIRAAIEERT